ARNIRELLCVARGGGRQDLSGLAQGCGGGSTGWRATGTAQCQRAGGGDLRNAGNCRRKVVRADGVCALLLRAVMGCAARYGGVRESSCLAFPSKSLFFRSSGKPDSCIFRWAASK